MKAELVKPMLATLGKPPTSSGFAVEAKYGEQRGLANVDGEAVKLLSRNGANHTSVGALLVGAYSSDERLVFCGAVGAGISRAQRRILQQHFSALSRKTSPFREPVPDFIAHHARWVSPRLVGDIEYRAFNGTLGHASWKGLRSDLDVNGMALPVFVELTGRRYALMRR